VSPVEWCVFVLRVLSELSLVLLLQESDGTEDEQTEEQTDGREEGGRREGGRGEGSSCNQIAALISKSLLPRLVLS